MSDREIATMFGATPRSLFRVLDCDGWNIVDGEEIFFVSNPGLGLWAFKGRFKDESRTAEV